MKCWILLAVIVALANAACTERRIDVYDAATLNNALNNAQPGDSIVMAVGNYYGRFYAKAVGRLDCPIKLTGTYNVVIDGQSIASAEPGLTVYGDYWMVSVITITNARIGLEINGGQYNSITSIMATDVGEAGFRVVSNSNNNYLYGLVSRNTGKRTPSLGYGIVLGNDDMDVSAYNTLQACSFAEYTTQSCMLIHASSGHNMIRENSCIATGMTDGHSWVVLKSDYNEAYLNSGTNPVSNPAMVNGWEVTGNYNYIHANYCDVRGSGYGFYATGTGNRICASNKVYNAAKGLTNVAIDATC
jgi:hypothetical protein